jgi:hypothetical protein
MSDDAPSPAEERPFAPALIAGAVRGLPAGAANATVLVAVLFVAVIVQSGKLGVDELEVLLVGLAFATPCGAAIGAVLSAADAASRRSLRPELVRLSGGVLAPLAAFFVALSVAMILSGSLGPRAQMRVSDVRTVFLGLGCVCLPLSVSLICGGSLAGAPRPGRGRGYAFERGFKIAAGPAGLIVLLALMGGGGRRNESTAPLVFLLALVALAAGTAVHVLVHRASRPIYRRVRSWFELESAS